MMLLYRIYQLCIALPVLLVCTMLTAIVTIIGSWIGNAHFWGYYPGKIWSIIICRVLFIQVVVRGHENVDKKTSYVFVANHQGAFDIFLIYGFLGRNFKWMMKKSLRKILPGRKSMRERTSHLRRQVGTEKDSRNLCQSP